MKTIQQGALGEALARQFLESQGYEFLDANFRRRVGEIDLIMLSPCDSDASRTTVFVEVRYRTTSGFGGALGSIDWKKQRKMVRVANAWLQKNALSTDIARIDVIALEPDSGKRYHEASQLYYWRNHHLVWLKNAVEQTT